MGRGVSDAKRGARPKDIAGLNGWRNYELSAKSRVVLARAVFAFSRELSLHKSVFEHQVVGGAASKRAWSHAGCGWDSCCCGGGQGGHL